MLIMAGTDGSGGRERRKEAGTPDIHSYGYFLSILGYSYVYSPSFQYLFQFQYLSGYASSSSTSLAMLSRFLEFQAGFEEKECFPYMYLTFPYYERMMN